MSANACVAYFGLRFEISPGEINALETRTDSRLIAANRARLKCFWANFGAPNEHFLLFVGAELGVFGPENRFDIELDRNELADIVASTVEKLSAASLQGVPKLHIQWYSDA